MSSMDDLIAQLELYIQDARSQVDVDAERASYWRGVIFGLELALLEMRRHPAPTEALPEDFYEAICKLVFDHLETLIEQCQARIQRDLLVFNAKTARYELLRAIRRAAPGQPPSDYE